ncbi:MULTISPECIES: ABC transporter substrate-binding protein [Paenibacillus]|uniref:ABC transporter substrate-binding protein n=1 Tax=Paenibacillus TaxID=44249 RepID=UPI000433AFAF|nr:MULTISPECIES: ABC transporter substrate-binding protein [Paenibacillus]KKC48726.1 ABC transporter substrate-binding protein [Paenibacillus sp. D9]CDN43833.1 ABC transporter, solute-binding protein [Paenibacillus sp. P22]
MKKRSPKAMGAIALILTAALTVTACGKSGGAAEGTAEKPVNLIWYTIGAPQKDTDKVMAEVNKYTAEKIGATVTLKQIDFGDYNQKMGVMTASGEPMDILFTSSWAFDYVQNARKGAFLAIDDLLKSDGKGIVDTLDPAFLEGSKVDGHNYGIPANKELPAQTVYRFNKQNLDKLGLDYKNVKTLEDLEPILKANKEKNPGVLGLKMDNNFTPFVPYDYIIQGLPMAVALDGDNSKIVNVLDTPEMKQALTTMNKYYKAGYISPEAATTTSTGDVEKTGKWLIDLATTQPLADNTWSASLGYPIESTPAGPSIIYNWSVMGSMQAISANSEYPEKAMQFLNLLNTDAKLRNMVDSGIEGTHYKMTGDNRMENLPESKNYDMPTFSLGNVMLTYLNPGDPDNKWDEFKKFNDEGKNAPTLGFNFDTSKVANEIAALQNVKAEVWAPLMTGTVDPAGYLPRANEKLKAAGLDKIIAEAQAQLDAWKASKK